MKVEHEPLARNTDGIGPHQAAANAKKVMGKHKRMVLDIVGRHEHAMHGLSPKEIGKIAYHEGLIALEQIESLRRRVGDVWKDGNLHKVGMLRDNAEVYCIDPALVIRKRKP